METLLSVLFVLVIVLFIVAISLVCVEYIFTPKNMPKIKFKSFRSFYALNPDRWDLYDEYVECKTRIVEKYGPSFGCVSRQGFRFGLINLYRYKLWYKRTEDREREMDYIEQTSAMLKAVKQDLAKFESSIAATEQKALKNIQDIVGRM